MISYMMNVLIVDDSQSCRESLRQAFANHLHSCKLFEVQDGQEAMELCKTQSFDLIFLGVTMPIFDGIETTKMIRQIDPYVLMIALSTHDDDETISAMLKAGAADFIKEPYDAVLIEKRVYNYLSLANYRRFITGKYTSVSLFNEHVFKRVIVFHISTEDELSEFWEFFLTHYTINQSRPISQNFYPAVKIAFNVIEILYGQNKKTTVVYESNELHSHITIGPIRAINHTLLKEIIETKAKQLGVELECIFSELKFSLRFKKYAEELPVTIKTPSPIPPQAKIQSEAQQIQSTPQVQKPVELFIADFLDPDEINDLSEAILNLETKLNVLQYSSLLPHEALEIADSLKLMAKSLVSYNDFSNVAIAFRSLAFDIEENTEAFVQNSQRLTKLFMAFIDNLKVWERRLFREGIERFDAMNATLIADSQQITYLFCQRSGDIEDNVDDIFF